MTILVVQTGSGDCIAAWSLPREDYPEIFAGYSAWGLTARREDAIEAADELERRLTVFAEWVLENDPRECEACGGAADPVELLRGYPLCLDCSRFETRRRYG